MERPSRDQQFIDIAHIVARRATCGRAQVGAVVTKDSRIISTGYNGPPSGMPHCSPDTCDLKTNCTRSVHAEANSIYYAAREGISVEGATIYCTHSPCIKCAEAIINSGIVQVIFEEYYGVAGLTLLMDAGIKTREFREEHSMS